MKKYIKSFFTFMLIFVLILGVNVTPRAASASDYSGNDNYQSNKDLYDIDGFIWLTIGNSDDNQSIETGKNVTNEYNFVKYNGETDGTTLLDGLINITGDRHQ